MKYLKPLDFAVILIVCAAAAIAVVPVLSASDSAPDSAPDSATEYVRAVVTCDAGQFTLPLSGDCERTVESGGHRLTVRVADGGIYVADSDCADRLCVRTGRISRAGQTVICVPARVLIEIKGGDGSVDEIFGEIDAAAG